MYYSAWDCQCNQYFHTGRNNKTRKECFEDIRDWLVGGSTADGEDEKKMYDLPEWEILEMFDVEIHKHSRLIPEEVY